MQKLLSIFGVSLYLLCDCILPLFSPSNSYRVMQKFGTLTITVGVVSSKVINVHSVIMLLFTVRA